MSGRRYEGPLKCLMGWSTACAQLTFDDGVTVPFRLSGHKSREEATQRQSRGREETKIRVRIYFIIHKCCLTIGLKRRSKMR